MGVKLVSASGGSVEIVAPATASNFTATMPANTGTVITTASSAVVSQSMLATGVAGTGPAFSAYQSSSQSLSSGATTKVQFQTEEFDTANCFDNVTNYRFTPNVAGYYQVNLSVRLNPNNAQIITYIYKNGSGFKQGAFANSSYQLAASVNALIYLNGSTDYIEGYVFNNQPNNVVASNTDTYFQAFLARSA